jgi:hypothetical protein
MIRMETLERMRVRNFDTLLYLLVTITVQCPTFGNGLKLRHLFYDDISTGIKVIGMMSIGELIPRYFSTTKRNCAEVFKKMP